MNTTSLRHPELPLNSLLINVSKENLRQELFLLLINGGIQIKEFNTYF